MKKIIIPLLLAAMLTSCMPTPYLYDRYEMKTQTIDLTMFEQEGIFVTSGDISSKTYNTKGLVIAECFPGYDENLVKQGGSNSKNSGRDDIYTKSMQSQYKGYQTCSYNELLQAVIGQAKSNKANAIINLRISNVNRISSIDGKIVTGIRIEGLAVVLE